MGTWGAGIFDDDTALDVRDQYLDAVAAGADDAAVTARLIEEWTGTGVAADDDEALVFWLALAATQWEYGRLRRDVKQRALDVIKAGDPRFTGGPDAPKRARALQRLAAKLQSRQPKRKTPRRRSLPAVRSTTLPSPDGTASATAFIIGNLAQVMIEQEAQGTRGGGGVFAAECAHDAIELRWIDAATLEIAYPASARVQQRAEQSYFYGRITRVRYRAR